MKFSAIDEINRSDHYHLRPDDTCIFLHEYTSGAGYKGSTANGLISNLKKKPSNRGRYDYRYKGVAIRECATTLAGALNQNWLNVATLVPIPGSKAEDHPDYDDRMEQICRLIRPVPALDVRKLVRQTASTEASHESENRVSIAELLRLYEIDESLTNPVPTAIGIFDDVLTAGVHFRAMHTVLSQRFPGCPITGIFIARRIFAKQADVDSWFEEFRG